MKRLMKKEPTPIDLVAAAMSEELHFEVTSKQAIQRHRQSNACATITWTNSRMHLPRCQNASGLTWTKTKKIK
jgi:hypothetical protein